MALEGQTKQHNTNTNNIITPTTTTLIILQVKSLEKHSSRSRSRDAEDKNSLRISDIEKMAYIVKLEAWVPKPQTTSNSPKP